MTGRIALLFSGICCLISCQPGSYSGSSVDRDCKSYNHRTFEKVFYTEGYDHPNQGDVVVMKDSSYVATAVTDKHPETVVMVRFDKTGEKLWAKEVVSGLETNCKAVKRTKKGNLVLAVDVKFQGRRQKYIAYVRMDPQGNILNKKVFGNHMGSDRMFDIAIADNNDILLSGYTIYGKKNADIYVARMRPSGEIVWKKHIDSRNYQVAIALTKGDGDNFYLAGKSAPSNYADDFDGVVCKINGSGKVLWYKTYEHTYLFRNIEYTPDNNLVCSGDISADGTSLVAKLDLNGKPLWARSIRYNKEPVSTRKAVTGAATYTFTGYGKNTLGNNKMLMFSFTPDGKLMTAKGYGTSPAGSRGIDISKTLLNGYILYGDSNEGMYFAKADACGETDCSEDVNMSANYFSNDQVNERSFTTDNKGRITDLELKTTPLSEELNEACGE